MNKNAVISIIAIAAVVAGVVWYVQDQNGTTSTPSSQPYNQNPSPTYPNPSTQATGKVIFSITDAATSMQGITSITMTISGVEMHSAAQGWITVSSAPKDFDLLKLKSTGQLMVKAASDVAADNYDQIRVHVDKIIVVKSGTTYEAKLPSGELRMNTKVNVASNATTSVKLDFLADKSLHTTGKGEFIFAPVMKVESRSGANVAVQSSGIVTIGGGKVDTDEEDGMDINGDVKENFMLNTNEDLEINGGVIRVKGSGSTQTSGSVYLKL